MATATTVSARGIMPPGYRSPLPGARGSGDASLLSPRRRCYHRLAGGDMRHALTWLIGMASVLAGCTMRPPRSAAGATLGQLYQRAQIDLGCAMPYLRDFPLDGRTRLVQGCGRQLIYVESCDPIRGAFQCTWLADSPAVAVSPAPSSQAPASTAVASQ